VHDAGRDAFYRLTRTEPARQVQAFVDDDLRPTVTPTGELTFE
jgi:hypothetical protein